MASTKKSDQWRGRCIAGVLALVSSGIAAAQGADVSGALRAGVSSSDNIYLESSPDETEETIYQVSPSLGIDYSNQRIDSSLRYQFDWYRYADLGTSSRYHRYDARLTGDLIEDALSLEIGGSRSQALKNPDFVIPGGGLPISGNLADRDDYYVEPRLATTLGRSVSLNASYRYSEVLFDESDFDEAAFIQDNTNQDARFRIDNYRRERGLTWALGYDWQETEYDDSFPWEFNKAAAELGFYINGKTRMFASGGKESAWDDPVDRSLQDEFWEGGFAYRGGEKLSAEFAAGERSFGTSWRGQLDFAFRRGTLAFSYAERPTTNGFNRFSRGNLFDPEEPDDFLTRPGSAERFVSERGQANLQLDFRRTGIGLIVYDETRAGRFTAEGDALPDESQNGVSLSISWQAGVRTALRAAASFNNRKNTVVDDQDFVTALFGVDYRIGRRVSLSLAYNYSEQDPSGDSGGRDYVANVVSFFVTYTL